MNRGGKQLRFFLFLSTLLLSLAVVSAACANPQQLILRLSASSNAHGQVPGQSPQYGVDVCYNDLFGITYSGANPQTCTGSNTVLRLSASTNAHATSPTNSAYGNSVCYGDLICSMRTGSCSAGEHEIVALSATTNAHLETATNNQYTNVICCSSATAGGGSPSAPGAFSASALPSCSGTTSQMSVSWTVAGGSPAPTYNVYFCSGSGCTPTTAVPGCSGLSGLSCTHTPLTAGTLYRYNVTATNTQGKSQAAIVSGTATTCSGSGTITSATWNLVDGSPTTTSNVNQTVRMRVTSSGLSGGTQIRFNIYEDDGILGNTPVLVGAQAPVATIDAGGVAFYDWFINDTMMAIANDNPAEFFFNATASTASTSLKSGILTVQNTPGPNNPPVVTIANPKNKGIYFNSTTVVFNHTTVDLQGSVGLTYKWTIAEDNFQSTQSQFSYQFKTPGLKTVTLKVTDPQGASDENQVSVLVLASPGALAFVNAPQHKEVIPAQQNGQLRLTYNASESYVVNSTVNSACVGSLSCLAGPCPARTENAPASCGPAGTTLPIAANGNLAFANTNFSWYFSSQNSIANASGIVGASGIVPFGKSEGGERILNLTVSYKDPLFTVTSTSARAYTLGQCVGTTHKYWIQIGATGREVQRLDTEQPNGACRGAFSGPADDCCRDRWVCGDHDNNVNTLDQCYDSPNDDSINACGDYTTQSDCINDVAHVLSASGDPLWTQRQCGKTVNGEVIECSCIWEGPTNSCVFNSTGVKVQNPSQTWSCISSYTQGECVSGYMLLDITNVFNAGTSGLTAADVGCISEQRQVLCGKPIIELSFFDYRQILGAAALIIVMYLILIHTKRSKR